jgi:hypothetical protein
LETVEAELPQLASMKALRKAPEQALPHAFTTRHHPTPF